MSDGRRPTWGPALLGAVVALAVLWFMAALLLGTIQHGGPGGTNPVLDYLAPFLVYLVMAVLLTVRRRTRPAGAGLLIALGVWLVIAGVLWVSGAVSLG